MTQGQKLWCVSWLMQNNREVLHLYQVSLESIEGLDLFDVEIRGLPKPWHNKKYWPTQGGFQYYRTFTHARCFTIYALRHMAKVSGDRRYSRWADQMGDCKIASANLGFVIQ